MADLSNPLPQVVVGQAQPAVVVNNLVDALSPAACFGQNDLTTSGLTWGYFGGRFIGTAIADGTIALPANEATIYIVAAKATGVVSQSTSITNWNDTTNYQPLYIATTGPSTITDWDDYREFISGTGGGGGGGGFTSEQIEDIVGALLTAGTNITLNYNDSASPPTLEIASTGGASWGSITGTLASQSDLQNELNAKVTQATFEEQVQDIVGALLTAGTNVSLNYNDGDSPPTLSISSTGGGGGSSITQEQIEDIVASLITAGSGITVNYNDGDSPATLVLTGSGGLTHFTESVDTSAPNASTPVVQLLATNAATDVDIALTPKGGGSLVLEIPDNTTAGGDKRGSNAVDFQMSRANSNQVASGQNAFAAGASNRANGSRASAFGSLHVASGGDSGAFGGTSNTLSTTNAAALGGAGNTVSGTSAATAGGTSCTASGTDSFAHGTENIANASSSRAGGVSGTVRAVVNSDVWGGGVFNNPGDYQRRQFVLRQRTTDATPAAMTTNGSAAAATNQVNVPSSGAACFITGHAIVTQPATGDTATWTFNACVNNIGGTTALVGAATVTAGPASAGAATWTLGITADDTNDAFTFTCTGEASHTLAWVAYVVSAEAGPI